MLELKFAAQHFVHLATFWFNTFAMLISTTGHVVNDIICYATCAGEVDSCGGTQGATLNWLFIMKTLEDEQ